MDDIRDDFEEPLEDEALGIPEEHDLLLGVDDEGNPIDEPELSESKLLDVFGFTPVEDELTDF